MSGDKGCLQVYIHVLSGGVIGIPNMLGGTYILAAATDKQTDIDTHTDKQTDIDTRTDRQTERHTWA